MDWRLAVEKQGLISQLLFSAAVASLMAIAIDRDNRFVSRELRRKLVQGEYCTIALEG